MASSQTSPRQPVESMARLVVVVVVALLLLVTVVLAGVVVLAVVLFLVLVLANHILRCMRQPSRSAGKQSRLIPAQCPKRFNS